MYSSRAIRTPLRNRKIGAVIPEPADQAGHRKPRGSRGGRPPAFHEVDYRGRNVIDRYFNQLKHWRGIATRIDKLANIYRAAIVLHAVITWTTTSSDMT
ncbi:transposase [Amycolatopsis pithecellobii]|uniref:transposase n=1 Tax=Amycolatopsis pithecellobii TaxID=664692 RepID=UPI00140D9376